MAKFKDHEPNFGKKVPCCPPSPDSLIEPFALIGCSVLSLLQVAGATEAVGLP